MTLRLKGKSLQHGMASNINTSKRKSMSARNRNWSGGGKMCAHFSNDVQQPL